MSLASFGSFGPPSPPAVEEPPQDAVDQGGVAGRFGAEGDPHGVPLAPGDGAVDVEDVRLAGPAEAEAHEVAHLPALGDPGEADASQRQVLELDGQAGAVLHLQDGVEAEADAHVPLAGEPQEG